MRQCVEIQSRAADEDWNSSACAHAFECGARVGLVARDGIVFVYADMAKQEMRRAGQRGIIWSRRQNARLAIHLHRIGVDECAMDAFRKRERGLRLAARGRPCDKHGIHAHRKSAH